MMPKEESKKQLITRATQYGVDPKSSPAAGGVEVYREKGHPLSHGLRHDVQQFSVHFRCMQSIWLVTIF